MDGFGHDVAQKIKSAIKAKLVELDAYVDDELPDYIMVMVANKKPKAQMTEDLSLFLGDNTCKFTDWLHEVLQRLQSVTLDGQHKTEIKSVDHESAKSEVNEVVSTSEKDFSVKQSQKDGSSTEELSKTPVLKQSDTTVVVPAVALPDAEIQDEMLTIKAEPESGDLLDEELRDDVSTAAGKPERTKPISGNHSLTRPAVATSSLVRNKSKHDQTTLIEKSKLPSSESTNHGTSIDNAGIPNIREPSNLMVTPSTAVSGRKRKTPCSTVGAVVQREFPQEEEDDDEYDPRHPTIGAVASIVQVTQRRSSVPPERQANKLLLFKAVNEAEKSVHQASHRPTLAIRDGHESTPQLFTRRYLERQKLERQQQQVQKQLQLQQQSQLVQKQVKTMGTLKKSDPFQNNNSGLNIMNGKEETDALPASPHKQDHQEMEIDEQIDASLLESAPVNAAVENSNRVVVLQERVEERPVSPKFIITLDGVDAAAFESHPNDNQWSESGDYLVLNEDVASMTSDQDELIIKEDIEANAYSEFMDIGDSQDTDHEDGDEDYSISPKKKKMTERCRYWPGCKNGNECSYYHPTVHCKTFPNCKFGNKCLYIHPNCKFDSACTRRDCPFTHASPRVHHFEPVTTLPVRLISHTPRRSSIIPATGLTPQKIKCRNFPTCSNVDCPYYHPKPCRYGRSCVRSDCIFFHPPLPTPDKLKWNKTAKLEQQSPSTPVSIHSKNYTSERKFAVSQVQQTIPVTVETIKT